MYPGCISVYATFVFLNLCSGFVATLQSKLICLFFSYLVKLRFPSSCSRACNLLRLFLNFSWMQHCWILELQTWRKKKNWQKLDLTSCRKSPKVLGYLDGTSYLIDVISYVFFPCPFDSFFFVLTMLIVDMLLDVMESCKIKGKCSTWAWSPRRWTWLHGLYST